jgi:hypothetical protein
VRTPVERLGLGWTVSLAVLLIWTVVATAQQSDRIAEIQKVKVTQNDLGTKIEITLTSAVKPTVLVATAPDRLVLELPNTTASSKQQHIAVNQNGVKGVRFGLNGAHPPVTHLVVDLASARQYSLATEGDVVTFTVLPRSAKAVTTSEGAKPAASAPLIAKLWPWQKGEDIKQVAAPTIEAAKPAPAPKDRLRSSFRVKYVAEGAAYLDGGRSAGLAVGMKLVVRENNEHNAASGRNVAELTVVSLAETSAVTEIHAPQRDVKPGDWAYLASEDSAKIAGARALNSTGTSQPENVPLPGSPRGKALRPGQSEPSGQEESRISARVGLDYSGIHSTGSTAGDSGQVGLSVRADMTRIGGTYWNLQGYWRDRITTNSQTSEQTVQDYLDKTYTIQLYYDNPNSKWLAGVGRLYLPWAVSLDTIDGGYVGRRVGHGAIAGVFGGSTPDPASWHYKPNQQIAGSFVNLEGGDYDAFHYTSTTGVALSMLKWQLERPYVFFENGISYSKYLSVYHSLIVDSPQGVTTNGITPGTGISRSYLTFHLQPHPRIGFDIYHNYFRDVPTAATALVGTGLVDKLLYQGINAGVRVEPVKHFTVYTTIGQSDKTGDDHRSLNQMYGITWNEILHTGFRADVHYSKFDSSFARGDYRLLTISRYLGDRMQWETQIGSQSLTSPFTVNDHSLFVDTSLDTNLGKHSYVQSGVTFERGAQLNYEQWYISLGYRFDVKGPVK